jgi:hypothetical protein
MSNGKTQRSRRNGTAAVVESTALALPQITRAEANQILKARAVELYHDARSAQQHQQRDFEAQYGRADRIDAALLAELQHLQLRFAAIAARQRSCSTMLLRYLHCRITTVVPCFLLYSLIPALFAPLLSMLTISGRRLFLRFRLRKASPPAPEPA